MTKRVLMIALGITVANAVTASAATPEELEATIGKLEQRIEQQDKRIAELEAAPDRLKDQQSHREAIREVLKGMNEDAQKRSEMPGWLENLKFYGDLRLRYQGDFSDWGSTSDSERKDRNRARFRLRVGAEKTWLEDQLEVGFRIATGESSDPTSTNQSMTGNFSKKDVWLDLAYARYAPKAVKGFSITGGKMKNPWLMNEIFMDSDINPEGFWAEYKAPPIGPVEPFVGAGHFVLMERAGTSSPAHDTIMYGYQAGLAWKAAKDVKYTFATYYQDYDHFDDSGALARGNDSPLTRVPDFGVIGLTNKLDFKAGKLPMSVFFDWARNCREADSTSKYEDDKNAYFAGIKIGENKKKGDWSAKYIYAILGANSLPGTFTDADFGFANRRGHVLRGEYNILDNLTAGVTLFLTEPIFSPTTTSGSSAFEDKTTTVQVDLVWKF